MLDPVSTPTGVWARTLCRRSHGAAQASGASAVPRSGRLYFALEPSNGVQRSPSLNRLHSEEGENLAVTLERMRGISETLEPAAGDGV
mgnify:CR=1 FL=1